jgi:Chaperone of endosialidase
MKSILQLIILISLFSVNSANSQTINDYIISDNHSSYSTLPSAIFYSRTGHTGTANVAIGSGVLKSNTLGNNNTGLGFNALQGNITGNENTAVGTKALSVGSGNGVISYSNPTPAAIGNHSNTAIGFEAYLGNVASRNTAIGTKALRLNGGNYVVPFTGVFGNDNVAIGYQTLSKSQSGSGNVAIGTEAMFNYNYHIPADAGYNISIGYRSMYNAGAANNGLSNNIGIGVNTLNNEMLGMSNLALGRNALYSHNFGNTNIAIGAAALYSNVSGGSNICIGFSAGYNELGSDKLYIENTNSNSPLIGGDFANDIVGINMSVNSLASNPTWKLQVGGDINASGSVRAAGIVLSSDIRFKKNIAPLQNSLSNLLKINAVSYNWRNDDFTERNFSDKKQFGVIAQEIETIFPELIDLDSQGFKSVNYIALVPVMIEAIKELNQKITLLENQNKHSSNSK